MLKNKYTENTIVFIVLLLIFFILFKNAIYAPFTVEDEYLNIIINNPQHLFGPDSSFFDTLIILEAKFLSLGRLVIVSVFVIVARAKAFGLDPVYYHWLVIAFGLVSTFLMYAIARKLNVSKLNSYIGALVFITGNAYGEIFMRLHTGECPGILFFLIAIYAILRIDEKKGKIFFSLALFSGLLAAFSKESFILLFPLIFTIPFIRVEFSKWVDVFKKFKPYFIWAIILFVSIVLIGIFALKYAKTIFSYGQPLTLSETLINNTIWIFKWFVFFFPIVLIVIVDLVRKKKVMQYFPLILFSLAFIASQLIIYYKIIISFSQGRYMMPAGLIFIFVLVFSLEYIKKNYILLFKLTFIFVCVLLIRNAKITYINANEFNARANAFNLLINKMINEKPDKIAVYGGIEFFQSINAHFTLNKYYPNIITTPVVHEVNHKNPYANEDFKKEMQSMLNAKYQFETLEDLKADTSVNIMITAEPEEYLPVNYNAIMKTFKSVDRVSVRFSNPSLRDMANINVWNGSFKNSERTYLVFKK